MGKSKLYLFNNKFTGAIVPLTKKQGARLNEDWAEIKPAVNEKGENVLRMQLNGAVVDLQEVEGAAVPVVSGEITNGDSKPE